MNVAVKPGLLKWARERAFLAPDELARMLGTPTRPAPVLEWERTGQLPLRKLEELAEKTHTPFGYLFLPTPPEEPVPIRDFRRQRGDQAARPSPDLLDTIYGCQFRQAWMSAHLQAEGESPLAFVGSASVSDDAEAVASRIRAELGLTADGISATRGVGDAVLRLMSLVEEAGIMIQRSGVVGTQTRRHLEPDEFKGFALADRYAPLIFVNGKDWPASQMFTIAHECGHVWIGESAIPYGAWLEEAPDPTERFCNRVAAAVLMPAEEVRAAWRTTEDPRGNAQRVALRFRVSRLAALVRGRALALLPEPAFEEARAAEADAFAEAGPQRSDAKGGNFYRTAGTRLGRRFIREVLTSTLEGKTLYTEAFGLLGTRKTRVFDELVKRYVTGEVR